MNISQNEPPPIQKEMENLGIDPSASRMLSERSTIWARTPMPFPSTTNYKRNLSRVKRKNMENRGIDPLASRMRSERSTIWARTPLLINDNNFDYKVGVFVKD